MQPTDPQQYVPTVQKYPNLYQINPYQHTTYIPPPPPPPKTRGYRFHILLAISLLAVIGGIGFSAVYLPKYLVNSLSTTLPTATAVPQTTLEAPIQVSPANGIIFNNYPRTTTVTWQPIPGHAKYGSITYTVDIEYWLPCDFAGCTPSWATLVTATNLDAQTTAYTFDFVGATEGRWRVWAVDSKGVPGLKSNWWTFTYKV